MHRSHTKCACYLSYMVRYVCREWILKPNGGAATTFPKNKTTERTWPAGQAVPKWVVILISAGCLVCSNYQCGNSYMTTVANWHVKMQKNTLKYSDGHRLRTCFGKFNINFQPRATLDLEPKTIHLEPVIILNDISLCSVHVLTIIDRLGR